mmetsp:Transcript_32490/g.44072  ORF Transcript_32490/g.44072 Transcript_32490/m.44072 type:complete len:101 (-) Transcript_32490:124-426(-)
MLPESCQNHAAIMPESCPNDALAGRTRLLKALLLQKPDFHSVTGTFQGVWICRLLELAMNGRACSRGDAAGKACALAELRAFSYALLLATASGGSELHGS